jgi:hypothetical protein
VPRFSNSIVTHSGTYPAIVWGPAGSHEASRKGMVMNGPVPNIFIVLMAHDYEHTPRSSSAMSVHETGQSVSSNCRNFGKQPCFAF